MLPQVIIHNSVSLDGSYVSFQPNMGLHYKIAGDYHPDAHLIGSNTIKIGIELYGDPTLQEKKADLKKPERGDMLPIWVMIDTTGKLNGLLHHIRSFEFCKDVVVLISEKTPKEYIGYLKEREYDYHVVGEDKADLTKALELLSEKYGVKKVLADTGKILGNLLIEQGLASEISLLIHPSITGSGGDNLFSNIEKITGLELKKFEVLEKDYLWLTYNIAASE